MLSADRTALRIIVDEPRRSSAERRFRIMAIILAVLAAAALGWFAYCTALVVLEADLWGTEGMSLVAVGASGLVCGAVLAMCSLVLWNVVRQIRSRFPLGSTILAVGPGHVEGPQTGAIPYERVTGAEVHWRPDPARSRTNAHRTVRLTLSDASVVECRTGPFCDDASFGRIVHALQWELGRRGKTFATAPRP